MARMYSRKRGKSGSTRPSYASAEWVGYKQEEVENIIVKLAKQGKSTAEIGTALRDQYGIPSSKLVAKLKVSRVLEKHKLSPELPEDLFNLLKKAVKIKSHLDANNKDRYSKRGLELTDAKIRSLVKKYRKTGALTEDWAYDMDKAKLLVK